MTQEQMPIGTHGGGRSASCSGPSLSLCMIVKDEEKSLARCLDSVKEYVDEIVIVDTGSKDGTVEIARRYTEKVYIHAWENDFSKARNQSMDHATGEWIFIMDADEVLMPGSGALLRKAIEDPTAEGFLVHVLNVFNHATSQASVNQLRLFRNRETIRYVSIVHNRIEGCRWSRALPVKIFHYGYDLDPEAMQRKFERTTALLRKQVTENADDPLPHHYLCVSYLGNSMNEPAGEEGMRAIKLAEEQGKTDLIYIWTHFMTGAALLNLRDLARAEEYALRALKRYEENLDSHYLLVQVYYETKDWPKLLEAAANYFRIHERVRSHPEEFSTLIIVSANDEWRVRLFLAAAHWEMGNRSQALEQYRLSADSATEKAICYRCIAAYHFRRKEWDMARQYFDLGLEKDPKDPELLAGKGLLLARQGDTQKASEYIDCLLQLPLTRKEARLLADLGGTELAEGDLSLASRLLRRAHEEIPKDPQILVNLGLACKKSGNKEEALQRYRQALEEDPRMLDGLVNLGNLYFEDGSWQEAREFLERALAIEEGLLDAHLLLARIDAADGAVEAAVARCDSLLKLLHLPRNYVLENLDQLSDLYALIGKTLAGRARPALARVAFETAVALRSEPAGLAAQAADLFMHAGNYPAALPFLETALRADPHQAVSFERLGECYAKMGAAEAATTCFAHAKELYGNGPSH